MCVFFTRAASFTVYVILWVFHLPSVGCSGLVVSTNASD